MSTKSDPAVRFQAVDLSGGNVTFSPPCRAVIVNTGGVITGIAADMTAAAATKALPAGIIPISFKQINQTGTTAADITAVW